MNRHSFCVLPWELVISFEIVCVLSSICLHNLIITKADYNSLIAVNLPQLALLWLKLCYLVFGMLELILYVSLGDRMLNQILLFLWITDYSEYLKFSVFTYNFSFYLLCLNWMTTSLPFWFCCSILGWVFPLGGRDMIL